MPPAIAIVSVNQNKYSETFIHNHVRHLPAQVHYLFNGYLPTQYSTQGVNGTVHTFLHKQPWWLPWQQNNHLQLLVRSISAYLVKHHIRVVLAEYGPSGVAMLPVCKQAKIPLVVHFHGYDAYRDDIMQSYGIHYPDLFNQAAAVIAVSKHMVKRLVNLGCKETKIHYCPYGYDTQLFMPAPAELPKPPHFLSVGRFDDTKAPHLTILAFAQVAAQMPHARLYMAGNGHLLDSCRILVQALKLSHAVLFLGSVSHPQVARLMQQSLAFVQHSVCTPQNDTEGTPVAIIEAMASGLPVVSTHHAGIPDVIQHGQSGFLVAEGDVTGMAAHLLHLAQHTDIAAQMGNFAQQWVSANRTLQQHIEQVWQALQGVM